MAYLENSLDQVRIAVLATRSVGGAVIRNRMKRRIRAALVSQMDQLPTGRDYLFTARRPLLDVNYSEIVYAIQVLIRRITN
jgi:ribonuclease P protein component